MLLVQVARAGEVPPPPPGLENIPVVVAQVNGQPIHRNDLLREMVASGGNEALDRLVRRILVEQAAKTAGVADKVTPEVIDQQFVIDKRDLMAELIQMPWDKTKEFPIADIVRARFHMTLDEYKSLMIRQRLLTKFSVVRDLQPTEKQLFEYFKSHLDDFQPPTMYRASHILISPISPRDLHNGLRFRSPAYQAAEAEQERRKRINMKRDSNIEFKDQIENYDPLVVKSRQTAEQLLKNIRAGTIQWDQAVRQYSQDPLDQEWTDNKKVKHKPERQVQGLTPGEIGWFTKLGPLEPNFYEAVKDLKVGDPPMGPVQTIYGFHLVKMLEIKNPAPVTFEQVRDKVERAYVEAEIQARSEGWMKELLENATLQSEPVLLWPLQTGKKVEGDVDPIVGSVNGAPIKRSDIWRELFRSESDDALDRLIHYEIVMTMLKTLGMDRMEWESSDPKLRGLNPPRAKPVVISAERVDLELNDDRLRKEKEAPDMSFNDYIYMRYGQSVDEYRQKLEAGLILRDSIRSKIKVDEKTLVTEWALAKDDYIEPIWYELSHILIVPTGGMDRADKAAMMNAVQIIENVRQKYIANPNDETWAKMLDFSNDSDTNKSRGGSLGPVYPDVRNVDYPDSAAIYREVKRQKLEKGQISAPFRTFRGFHIVRVDAVHPSMTPDFQQVRLRVERDYLQERARMYTDLWLRALSTGAKIERFLNAAAPVDPGMRNNVPLPLPKD